MILVDTSGLLAALAPDQRRHAECAEILLREPGPFLVSPLIVAEVDYLLHKLLGARYANAWLRELARGAYTLAPLHAEHMLRLAEVAERYRDLEIGAADASIVVLSEIHRTLDVLTLDERHFRTLRGFEEQPFRLLPADG